MTLEEERNVAVLRRMYEGYSRKDPGPMFDSLHEDVTFRMAAPSEYFRFAGVGKGKAWVQRVVREIAEDYDWLEFAAREFIAQGDRVVALTGGKIMHRASGLKMAVDLVDVIRMKDGKILEFSEFFDTALVMNELQLTKPIQSRIAAQPARRKKRSDR